MAEDAYVEVSSGEARKVTSVTKTKMDKGSFRKTIESLSEKNEFRLNLDQEKLESLLRGVMENEKNHGLKYCPCRLTSKDLEKDLELLCPCNFRVHETYRNKPNGECWCGLFVKKE